MSYAHTMEAGQLFALGTVADAIEIAGCVDLGADGQERCDGEPADLWSVFFHFPAPPANDPDALAGAECVADRDTVAEARAFANELASRFGLPIHDFS